MIYESPDGGKTIYKRYPGSLDKVLIDEHLEEPMLCKETADAVLWEQIRLAAKSNPALKDAADQLRVLYELTKCTPESP